MEKIDMNKKIQDSNNDTTRQTKLTDFDNCQKKINDFKKGEN